MNRIARLPFVFAAGLLLSCRPGGGAGDGSCIADADCQRDGVVGRCVGTACAYPSEDCESGWKLETGECDGQGDSGEDSGSMGDGAGEPDMGAACGSAIGSCDKLDVLIVIDNSASASADELLTLTAETEFLDELLNTLTTEPCDVQVGVTTTDPAPGFQPQECRTIGALNIGSPLSEDCWGDNPPYYRTGDETNGLLCALVAGDDFDPDEQQMNALTRAIEPDMTDEGGCNEGFVRPDAKLILLLITDEDDDDDADDAVPFPERGGSGGGPQQWFDRIMTVKDLADVGFLAIVPTSGDGCGAWTPVAGNDDAVLGTAEFADRITTFGALWVPAGYPDNVEVVDICQEASAVVDEIKNTPLLDAVCNG